MTNQPLISVVIPAHNRSESIVRTIDSVREQTHANLEIIVVDDGSTDETHTIASGVLANEPRLRVLKHHHNLGAQAARNMGIKAALGSWVAFLDSDDVYLPDSLERRLAAALREGVSAAHGECLVLRSDGSTQPLGTEPMQGDIRRAVLAKPGPTFPGMLVKIQCLGAIGGLDESLVSFQEWDTAIRLSAITCFAFVSEPTFIYDQRGSDTISANRQRSVAGYEQVVKKHALAILRTGGPRVMSAHLLAAARQHFQAGQRWDGRLRQAAASIVWPFVLGGLARGAVHRLRRPSL